MLNSGFFFRTLILYQCSIKNLKNKIQRIISLQND
jgi:hypothetical protein